MPLGSADPRLLVSAERPDAPWLAVALGNEERLSGSHGPRVSSVASNPPCAGTKKAS